MATNRKSEEEFGVSSGWRRLAFDVSRRIVPRPFVNIALHIIHLSAIRIHCKQHWSTNLRIVIQNNMFKVGTAGKVEIIMHSCKEKSKKEKSLSRSKLYDQIN